MNGQYYSIRLLVIGCAALLSACGGGGGGDGGGSAPAPTYQTFSSGAAASSTLSGAALLETATSRETRAVSGTYNHATNGLTLSDGTYTLVDSDGPNAAGNYTDGNASHRAFVNTTGNYEYVRVYIQSYNSGGTPHDVTGYYGIATRPGDVPTAGSATYTGNSFGVIANSTVDQVFQGSSTVSADFGAGTVDVTMTGFTATDNATSAPVAPAVDTIAMTGMSVSGNSFSGGTLSTTTGGAPVDLTGTNTVTQAQGHFYGYDASISGPDEVGGLVYSEGDTGVIAGFYDGD